MTQVEEFTFAVWALIIAGLSLIISVFSLGWNVYRDVILKPRLKLRFSLSTLFHPTFSEPITSLILTATNLGPGSITCGMIHLKTAPFWRRVIRRTKHAVLLHDYQNPLSANLPAKLQIGEKIQLMIPYEKNCFLCEDVTHIGIADTFDRVHWAPARDVRKARKDYRRDFAEASG